MIRKFLMALVAMVALAFTAPVNAADMPYGSAYKAAPQYVPAAPLYNWTGLYVGIYTGWGSGDYRESTSFLGGGSMAKMGASGWEPGGINFGYDQQFGNLVIGGRISYGFDGKKASEIDNWCAGCVGFFGYDINTIEKNHGGSAIMRAGYVFAGRWMPYLGAGAAFGQFTANTATYTSFGQSSMEAQFYGLGWTGVAGIEAMITRSLSAYVEYGYEQIGVSSTCFSGTFCTKEDWRGQSVKLGINYKFNP